MENNGDNGVKSDRMTLSWRTIVIIMGLSFGLGILTAAHKAIFAQLGQLTAGLPSVGAFGNQDSDLDTVASETSPVQAPTSVATTEPGTTSAIATSSFQSSRPAPAGLEAPKRGDVRIVVMGDINERYRSTTYRQEVLNAVRLIPAWQPDLVLSVGDMVGGQLLSLTPEDIQAMWAGFDRHIFQPIRQAGLPMAIAMGKQDGSNLILDEDAEVDATAIPEGGTPGSYVFARERDGARAYWTEPERNLGIDILDQRRFPFQYSFVHNDIFYLVWDASSADLPDGALRWAERSLSSPEAQQAKMRISISHYPLYAIAQGRDRPSEFLSQGEEVRELLERYNVHTHISGHHHAYFPGHVGDLELLNSGALGISPRSWLGSEAPPQRTLTVMDIFFEGTGGASFLDTGADADQGVAFTPDTSPDFASGNTVTTVYTTYDMATGDVIDPTDLPRVIAGPTGLVLRQDIERQDLTYEDNRRYVQSW